MTDKDNLDEKLNTLGQAIGSDDKLLENVMSRINAKPNFGPTEAKAQNIWRIIMKSPLTKLAAAAVIVFAVIVGLSDLQFTNPVYGITDVAEILKKSGTVHFKGWQCASVQPELYDPNIIQPGQKETRALFEYWIDMETGTLK